MTIVNHQSSTNIAKVWQRLRRSRAYLLVLVGLIAMLTATVAIGQVSQNYALACRSLFTAGSGTMTNSNYGIIAALGMPIVPPADGNPPTYSVRGGNFALRAGFLPGYPTSVAASAESPSLLEQFSNFVRLPLIFKGGAIVGGECAKFMIR
jgi:hypothetical protein